MIEVKNLNKSFGSLRVLKDINLSVADGEVIAIIGPSGSGKSTLLRSLNLLEKADSGEILYGNDNILAYNSKQVNKYRSEVGMVFQQFNLFNNKTIIDNLTLAPLLTQAADKVAIIKKAEALLKRIDLEDKKTVFPATLSGGQKQRVAIVRALCNDPKVLLFDEPTSALDPEMVKEVLDLISDLVVENITMILVTHEMNFAREVADKIVFMDEGEIIEVGSPAAIFNNPKSVRLQKFLAKVL